MPESIGLAEQLTLDKELKRRITGEFAEGSDHVTDRYNLHFTPVAFYSFKYEVIKPGLHYSSSNPPIAPASAPKLTTKRRGRRIQG